jgi:hypothetical protein
MKCKEKGCKGKVNLKKGVTLCTNGGLGMYNAHPCNKCGRLHWQNGKAVFDEAGDKKAFLSKKGKIIGKKIKKIGDEKMKCVEKGCKGTIDLKNAVSNVPMVYEKLYRCKRKKCGRLHKKDGTGYIHKTGDKIYSTRMGYAFINIK